MSKFFYACLVSMISLSVFSVPLESIFIDNQVTREWVDTKGRRLVAKFIAISYDGNYCYLERDASHAILKAEVKNLSQNDRDLIKEILVENKYVFYKGEYCKVRGIINEDHISVETYLDEDSKSSRCPVILTMQDFSSEWREALRKEVLKGSYDLSQYDSSLIEKTILYDENADDRFVFTKVIDVIPEGLLVCRVWQIVDTGINTEALFSKRGIDLSRYKKGDLLSNDSLIKMRWYFCGWKLRFIEGKRKAIAFYCSDRNDWLKLFVGWMERHQQDQLVMDQIIRKKYNNNLGTLSYAADCVVIIKGGSGQGTCFIMSDGQKTWLYTNEHVARIGTNVWAESVSGKRYYFPKNVQVAINRDLFRFEVHTDKYLRVCQWDLVNDKAVVALGNSDGGGVITETYGHILGVGPTRIEVDAPLVRGNSGGQYCELRGWWMIKVGLLDIFMWV